MTGCPDAIVIPGISPKRRLWRMKRGGIEEVSRRPGTQVTGHRLTRRWAAAGPWRSVSRGGTHRCRPTPSTERHAAGGGVPAATACSSIRISWQSPPKISRVKSQKNLPFSALLCYTILRAQRCSPCAVCDGSFLSSHLVIRDVGSVCGLQASRLPYAAGSWKQ